MYGAFGKKRSHAPARPRKRQFRPEALRYFSQASSEKISGSQARNKFQIKNPYRSCPVQMILADTSIRQTAVANVSASIGIAVSRLNANFKSPIMSCLNHGCSTHYHTLFAQNYESAKTPKNILECGGKRSTPPLSMA